MGFPKSLNVSTAIRLTVGAIAVALAAGSAIFVQGPFLNGRADAIRANRLEIASLVSELIAEPVLRGDMVRANQYLDRIQERFAIRGARVAQSDSLGSHEAGDIDWLQVPLQRAPKDPKDLALELQFSPAEWKNELHYANTLLLFSGLLIILFSSGTWFLARWLFGDDLQRLARSVQAQTEDGARSEIAPDPKNYRISEMALVFEALRARDHRIAEMAARQAQDAADSKLGKMIAQIAHDIRSPLTALRVIEPTVAPALQPDEREIFREAVARIFGIAEGLLGKRKSLVAATAAEPTLSTTHRASAPPIAVNEVFAPGRVISAVIREKNLAEPGARVELQGPVGAGGSMDRDFGFGLTRLAFSRAVSNLIGNAVEASPLDASVSVRVEKVGGDKIVVEVADQEPGIPESVMRNLGRYGNTRGKTNGNGLGLAAVFESVEGAGGTVKVQTSTGGTCVRVELPVLQQ